MRRTTTLLLAICALALIWPVNAQAAGIEAGGAAQGGALAETEEETGQPETAAPAVSTAPPVLQLQEGGYVSTTPFGAEHYMTGLFSTITEGFSVGDWTIADALLTLSLSTTQLASEYLSTLTISINGVRFYSETVPPSDGLRRELAVRIPVEHIVGGYNVIGIEGYIRTYNGLPCVDDVTNANWLNVFSESLVEVSYTPNAACRTIGEFYDCFTSIDALENSQSAVIVPTDFDDDELAAAFVTLAGVSKQATKSYRNIELLAADSLKAAADRKYIICIAKPGWLPAELQTPLAEAGGTGGEMATLLFVPGTPNVLIVTAEDGAGLKKAAAALANAAFMRQMTGPLKRIGVNEDVLMRTAGVAQYTALTENGTYLDGAFRQEAAYFIDFANNRKLASGSEIELVFRYSKNLDFDRSLVTVYVNDVPVGSRKLSAERADGDRLVLSIPTDAETTGSFTLKAAFDLEIKDLWCTLRQGETPWAYISPESTLRLNSAETPYYLFENYPYPFVSDGAFNRLVLVLPQSNAAVDLALTGRLMLTLGRFIKYNTGELSVVRASQPGSLEGKNVIALGTPGNNAVIKGLNEHLYFRFDETGGAIQSNEKLLIEANYGRTLASAQLIESPYSTDERNAILVLASADGADLGKALTRFGDTAELWKLYGDGFVTDGEALMQYRFKQENAKALRSGDRLGERSDVRRLLCIALAAALLLATAAVLLFVRYRRKVK